MTATAAVLPSRGASCTAKANHGRRKPKSTEATFDSLLNDMLTDDELSDFLLDRRPLDAGSVKELLYLAESYIQLTQILAPNVSLGHEELEVLRECSRSLASGRPMKLSRKMNNLCASIFAAEIFKHIRMWSESILSDEEARVHR